MTADLANSAGLCVGKEWTQRRVVRMCVTARRATGARKVVI